MQQGSIGVFAAAVQALNATQERAEAAGQAAERWGDQASRLRAECSLLEASLRDQRLDAEREVTGHTEFLECARLLELQAVPQDGALASATLLFVVQFVSFAHQ